MALPPDNVEKAGMFRNFSLLETFCFVEKFLLVKLPFLLLASIVLYQALRLVRYQDFLPAVEIHLFCLPQPVDSVHQRPRGLEMGNQP